MADFWVEGWMDGFGFWSQLGVGILRDGRSVV